MTCPHNNPTKRGCRHCKRSYNTRYQRLRRANGGKPLRPVRKPVYRPDCVLGEWPMLGAEGGVLGWRIAA